MLQKKKIKIFRKELDLLELKKEIKYFRLWMWKYVRLWQYLFNNSDNYLGYDIYKPGIDFAISILKKKLIFKCFLKKFDVIICSEVLEHLEDPTIILKKLNKSLYTDGILLGSVPNGYV